MKMPLRTLCFAVGMVIFAWVFSQARVFNPDRSVADPSVPVILLAFVGTFVALLLWIYAFLATEARSDQQRCAGGTALPPAESPEPSEPAAGPELIGESSPPAV